MRAHGLSRAVVQRSTASGPSASACSWRSLALLVRMAGMHYLVRRPRSPSRRPCCTISSGTSDGRGGSAERSRRARTLARLARFHLLNGAISLVGNLALIAVLAGTLGMSIRSRPTSSPSRRARLVNFVASEVVGVRTPPATVAALAAALVRARRWPARVGRAADLHGGRADAARGRGVAAATSSRSTNATTRAASPGRRLLRAGRVQASGWRAAGDRRPGVDDAGRRARRPGERRRSIPDGKDPSLGRRGLRPARRARAM